MRACLSVSHAYCVRSRASRPWKKGKKKENRSFTYIFYFLRVLFFRCCIILRCLMLVSLISALNIYEYICVCARLYLYECMRFYLYLFCTYGGVYYSSTFNFTVSGKRTQLASAIRSTLHYRFSLLCLSFIISISIASQSSRELWSVKLLLPAFIGTVFCATLKSLHYNSTIRLYQRPCRLYSLRICEFGSRAVNFPGFLRCLNVVAAHVAEHATKNIWFFLTNFLFFAVA